MQRKEELEQYYLAPEYWKPIELLQNERILGDKLDVFSLGVMLFIYLFRSPPFSKAVI